MGRAGHTAPETPFGKGGFLERVLPVPGNVAEEMD